MYIKPRKNKHNELISYRLICSGKDPYSGLHKNYTKTWKVPPNLTKKELDHALKKVMFDFETEVEKLSSGQIVIEHDIMFVDFANQWLNNILNRNAESFTYYNTSKRHLQVILPYFQKYKLKNIGPDLIQNFYDYLSASTYEKNIVIVNKSINEFINYKEQYKIADTLGISRHTLHVASVVGNQVSMETAKKVCNYFNCKIENYFKVTTTKCKYSRATIIGIRTTLVSILAEAKRRLLIEHNYATKDYTTRPTGNTKKKNVLNEESAKRFIQCVLEETDPRKKAIFSIFLLAGLRKGEIAGLCRDDIDFSHNTLSVNRNCIYVNPEFGVVIKSPKTKKSKRTICMPNLLTEILQEYIVWWNGQKILHGDKWANSNFLFMQDNGNVINPCTIYQWLIQFEKVHGFEHIPCHSLRHSCCSLMINSGVPIKLVSQILGHTSEAFTLQVYTHVLEGQQEQAAITYNNFICDIK